MATKKSNLFDDSDEDEDYKPGAANVLEPTVYAPAETPTTNADEEYKPAEEEYKPDEEDYKPVEDNYTPEAVEDYKPAVDEYIPPVEEEYKP